MKKKNKMQPRILADVVKYFSCIVTVVLIHLYRKHYPCGSRNHLLCSSPSCRHKKSNSPGWGSHHVTRAYVSQINAWPNSKTIRSTRGLICQQIHMVNLPLLRILQSNRKQQMLVDSNSSKSKTLILTLCL